MSTATLEMSSAAEADDVFEYRALHTGALTGLVLAVLAAVFTIVAAGNSPEVCVMVALLNAPVLSLCLWSLVQIRRQPDHYTGRPLAILGIMLSLVFLFGGTAYGAYQYFTEVPEGYARISFSAMTPSDLQARNGVIVPQDIAALDGQRVFIRGYMRPDSVTVSKGIEQFLLVRDNNQCCFGDLSTVKYYDQILVDMVGSRRVDMREGIYRMGGVLKVEPKNAASGSLEPVFSLKADYAKY